jgi:hypothetical protein
MAQHRHIANLSGSSFSYYDTYLCQLALANIVSACHQLNPNTQLPGLQETQSPAPIPCTSIWTRKY